VNLRASAAQDRAEARMRDAHGSIRAAFDSLETGATFADVIAYADDGARIAYNAPDEDAGAGRIVGLAAALAIVVVELDRERSERL
jgi:hypothetical protein